MACIFLRRILSFCTLSTPLIVIFFGTSIAADDLVSNLKQIHIIYRHGDRAPSLNISGGYRSEDWPEGLGSLTALGIEQQFFLGEEFRIRYAGFISHQKQVYIRSTDHDRTLQSAAANAAGMFPPNGNVTGWNGELGRLWRPFPIHTETQSNEFLLKQTAKCPKLKKLNEELYNEPFTNALEAKNNELAALLEKNAGNAGGNFWDRITNLNDIFVCLKEHNLPFPVWTNATVRETIRELANMLFFLWVGANGVLDRAKLVGGPLLHLLITRLQSNVDPVKMYIYSGHDSTVAGLRSILQYHGPHDVEEPFAIPPYNAAIIIELFQNNTVRFLFKNETSKYHPLYLHHEKCKSYMCPLDVFTEVTKDLVVADWIAECDDSSLLEVISDHLPSTGFWVIATVIAFFILIILGIKWRRRASRKKAGDLPIPSTSDHSVSYRSLQNH